MSTKELMLDCDLYIVKALEFEKENLNRLNHQSGFPKVDVSGVARGVLADWAISRLFSESESKKNGDSGAMLSRAVS